MFHILAPSLADRGRHRHGVVTREELLIDGVPSATIARALGVGVLRALHPGVYVDAGTPDLWLSRCVGDVRYVDRQLRRKQGAGAARPTVALTGMAAAHLLDLGVDRAGTPVIVSDRLSRSCRVLRLHRPGLTTADVLRCQAVPVTSVAWTLVEISSRFRGAQPRNLVADALRTGRVRPEELSAAAERADLPDPSATHELAAGPGWAAARSDAERLVATGVVDRGLPPPMVNVVVEVGGFVFELDVAWPQDRFVVEVDGEQHGLAAQVFRDTHRDRVMRGAGWSLLRVSTAAIRNDLSAVLDLVEDAYHGHLRRYQRSAPRQES